LFFRILASLNRAKRGRSALRRCQQSYVVFVIIVLFVSFV